jgi:hypothetical protein
MVKESSSRMLARDELEGEDISLGLDRDGASLAGIWVLITFPYWLRSSFG